MPRSILHIDLDAFFVSVEQALNPGLRDRPVVVGGKAHSRGVVASASYQARAYGLRAGMPLATARRLCPQAVFLEGNFDRYRQASARFMDILADFTPELEPVGIDEAYLDLTGFEPLYGPAAQTALEIKRRIHRELGITASVGIATCKVVAKVASDLAKPDGLLEVPPAQETAFMAPLPLDRLPYLGPKSEQVLRAVGMTTIGQLAALPLSWLRHTFGAAGELMYRYANALDDRKVEPPPAAKSISRETTFAEDTLDQGFLEATLRYLGERVGAELRWQGKWAGYVTLKLRYADFETITRQRRLRQASNSDQAIFEAGLGLLEGGLARRRQQVRLIGIGVSRLQSQGRQLGLLDNSESRWEQLDQAIDRIRSRYGFLAIQVGRTRLLHHAFSTQDGHYLLPTPALSR